METMSTKHVVLAATLAAGSVLAPAQFNAPPVEAADSVCVYTVKPNTGSWLFEESTGVDIEDASELNGNKTVKQLFAMASFNYPCSEKAPNGFPDPNSSTTVTTLAPAAAPATTPSTPATSAPECAPTVKSRGEITAACAAAVSKLIKNAGYYDLQAYQQMNGITNYAQQSSTVGVKTYNWAMSGANLYLPAPDMKDRVVVDISDQTAIYYHNGQAAVISRISSGSGDKYTYINESGKTVTATAKSRLGTNKIYAAHGADHFSNDLGGQPGSMAWALPFDGGMALHTGNLPGYPASHGCIRLSRGNPNDPNDDAIRIMRDKGLGIGDIVTVQA